MTLSFNRAAIEAHVTLIHQLADGIDGIIPLFCVEEGKTPIIQRFRIGDVAGMVDTIMGSEAHPGLNIYAPWAVMRPDLEPGKKGGEADVVAVLGAVGDVDNDKYKIGELPVEASCVVESSAGNYQPGYAFSRPISVGEAKPILEALSDAIGGDGGTKDASHVWRIPGTYNWPTRTKLMRGRSPNPQQVTICKAFDGTLVIPEDLAAKLPAKKTNGHASPDYEPGEAISDWQEADLRNQLAAIPSDSRDVWVKVGMALHSVGRRDLWDEWSKKSSKFDAADQDRVWRSFKADRGITTGTILKLAVEEYGWVPPNADWIQLDAKHLNEKIEIMEVFSNETGEDLDAAECDADDEIGELPDELTHVPGLLGDTIDWINDTAARPNRVLAMGAAITVTGTLVGRRLAGPTLSGTHLYALALALTGAGKDHALSQIALLLKAAKARHLLGPGDFMSMSAVINLLSRKPLCLCAMDEFGALLKRISDRRASGHEKAITKILREAWGKSFKTYTPPEWAGKASEEIWFPALSIYGVSTENDFFSALQTEDTENGFLNRFLLLKTEITARDIDPKLDPFTVPANLGQRLARIYAELNPTLAGQTNLGPVEGPPHKKLSWGTGAKAVHARMKEEIADRNNDPFFVRTLEIAVRLATIASVENECVSREAMTWGRDLAMWSASNMAYAAESHMADNQRAATANKILRFIGKQKDPWVKRRDVLESLKSTVELRQLEDIFRDLGERGRLKERKITAQKGGRPSIQYRLLRSVRKGK